MGTRADFYIGRGKGATWLGSIAWDGYPSEIPKSILEAKAKEQYEGAVILFLNQREDSSFPKDGWPWPWNDSKTTDYAYALDNSEVWVCPFGAMWYKASEKEPDEEVLENSKGDVEFPNMKDIQKVTFGKRSGVMLITKEGIYDGD